MDIEEVKRKIKKLIALSQDTIYDAESHLAMQKAQELMVKYKLSQMDIKDEKEIKKCIQKKTILSYGTRSSDHYVSRLAKIVAENFCCVQYISTPYRSRTHYICFMGMEDDVEIACDVLYAANAAIIRGYNRVWKDMCSEYDTNYIPAEYFNPAKKGYINGYLKGLKYALDSQKEQNQEWGLVLVVPQEAQDYVGGLETASFSAPSTIIDNSYYDEGYSDGVNFEVSKKLSISEEKDKLESR